MQFSKNKFSGGVVGSLSVSLLVLAAPIAANEPPPEELLGKGGSASKIGAVSIHEDGNGSWAIMGAGSPDGKDCSVVYSSKGAVVAMLGPDANASGVLMFAASTIPHVSAPKEIKLRLRTDIDGGGKPLPAMAAIFMPPDGGQGTAFIPVKMKTLLESLGEAKAIWLEQDGKTIFRIDNVGGIIIARDTLARCMKMQPIKTPPVKAKKKTKK